jgi:hypothetical protein
MKLISGLKKHYAKAGVLVTSAVLSTSSFAALTAAEQAAFDAVSAKVSDLETAAYALMIVVLIAFIGMGLTKKFIKKGAS